MIEAADHYNRNQCSGQDFFFSRSLLRFSETLTDQEPSENKTSSILSPPRPTRKFFREYVEQHFQDLLDHVQLRLFRAACSICRSTPLVVHDAIQAVLRDATYYSLGRIRQVCYGNLTIARGELWDSDRIHSFARSIFDFWGKVVVEFFRLKNAIKESNWRSFINVRGRQQLEEAIAEPRGTIVAGLHMANWEFIGQSLAWMGYPITSIARRRHHSSAIDRELMDWRTRWGQDVVYTDESTRTHLSVLKNGELLGIVADQYSGEDGIFADFFGAPTAHYPGVAVLANRLDVPVVPVHCHRERDGTYTVAFDEFIQPVARNDRETANRILIRRLFNRFEQYIRRYPRQWMWFHRKWRDKWLRNEHLQLLMDAPYLTYYSAD